MPKAFEDGPYRFFFYSNDRDEPIHVHVKRERNVAKFWLDPVQLERSGGFRPSELRTIERIVQANQELLMEEWDGHFND